MDTREADGETIQEILIGEMVSLMVQDLEILLLLVYPRRANKMMNGQCPLPLREEKV